MLQFNIYLFHFNIFKSYHFTYFCLSMQNFEIQFYEQLL